MTRARLRDPDVIRDRAVAMYRAKLGGRSAAEVGALFSLTARHVNREIAALPEEIRRRVRGAIRVPGTIRDAKR